MAGTRNLADRNHTETLTHQKCDVETDTRYFYGPKPELAKPSKKYWNQYRYQAQAKYVYI